MKKKVIFTILIILIAISSYFIISNYMKSKDKPIENNTEVETIDIPKSEFEVVDTYNKDNEDRYISYKELHPDLSLDDIVRDVNVYIDYPFYTNIVDSINKYTELVLVNKYYYLGEDYEPDNLVSIPGYSTSNGIKGEETAVNHFIEMCSDAKKENLTIKAMSVYRSYQHQYGLYNGYLKSDPQNIVDTYSARPGYSEHQTGLAFDVYNTKVTYTSFGTTNEYIWVKNNAYKYGFIIRYTTDNEFITGYENEPWHLRYVGLEASKYIYENNITLEEYLLNKK